MNYIQPDVPFIKSYPITAPISVLMNCLDYRTRHKKVLDFQKSINSKVEKAILYLSSIRTSEDNVLIDTSNNRRVIKCVIYMPLEEQGSVRSLYTQILVGTHRFVKKLTCRVHWKSASQSDSEAIQRITPRSGRGQKLPDLCDNCHLTKL